MEKSNITAKLWREILDGSQKTIKQKLKEIYRNNFPKIATLIVNPSCPNKCKHCIYPSNYACFNKTLDLEEWKTLVRKLYVTFGFRHFIFEGRGLNENIIKLIQFLNKKFPDVTVGLIADGPAIKRYFNDLKKLRIEDLDISVDGLKESHDNQRNLNGSFETTYNQIKCLLSNKDFNKNIGKISLLSTLTSINKEEILPMIKLFNNLGIKNFFITPVNICAGRPDKSLKLTNSDIVDFIKNARGFFKELDDSFVSFSIYDDSLIGNMKKNNPRLFSEFKSQEDLFEINQKSGNNEFHLFWYPIAINGCREFVINSNGDIFTGLVQAYGKIPQKYIFGNVLKIKEDKETFFRRMTEKEAFNFYVDILDANWVSWNSK